MDRANNRSGARRRLKAWSSPIANATTAFGVVDGVKCMQIQSGTTSYLRQISHWLIILFIGVGCIVAATDSTAIKSERSILLMHKAVAQDQNQQKRDSVPVVIPTLTRFGFEPKEFKVPAGRYLLLVRNQSGFDTVDLRIQKKDEPVSVSEKHSTGKKFWEKPIMLTPGDHFLKEANHPSWVCKITVLPPGQQ